MEPTLKTDSLILGTRVYGDIEVGDIVIFKYEGNLLVKRVAAKGGDDFEIDGVTYSVPDGCYFMLGDIGRIPTTRVFGKIRMLKKKIYWQK